MGLKKWAELFGPTAMDQDLWLFIKDIADLEPNDVVNEWRSVIANLMLRVAKKDFPMNQLDIISYHEMERQNHNSIIGLFALHSACFRTSAKTGSNCKCHGLGC
jgi:hypothetical protein